MTRFFAPKATAALLAGALLAATALPASAAMSDAERADFRAEVRAYLLENPEVIMEALQTLDTRQAAQKATDDAELVKVNADAIFHDDHSWVGGNPEGDVTLVEFMDYRCGYCRKAIDEIEKLVESDGNIRFVIKEFPILGDASLQSARFAIAVRQVAGDDAYKSVHDALMAFNGAVDDAAVTRLSRTLGLDGDAILAKMESPDVDAEIAQNHQLAARLQINGTPTFVLGDQMVRGYVPLDGMRHIVGEVRTN